jgi:hypothetical protein
VIQRAPGKVQNSSQQLLAIGQVRLMRDFEGAQLARRRLEQLTACLSSALRLNVQPYNAFACSYSSQLEAGV